MARAALVDGAQVIQAVVQSVHKGKWWGNPKTRFPLWDAPVYLGPSK